MQNVSGNPQCLQYRKHSNFSESDWCCYFSMQSVSIIFCVKSNAVCALCLLNTFLKISRSLSWFMRIKIHINLTMPRTFKTSIIIAVVTRHIIPSVTMLGSKSVNTVFVFPVIRLLWGPEPKTTYFFVCPHKGALHTSVIESNPRSLSAVTVLNVDIFFLIVNRYQIGTHGRTV